MLIGFAGGFAGGLVGTGSLRGALFGGFAGALAGGIGYGFEGGFGDAFGRAKELARAAAHGINGGVMSELGGGSFRAGFLGGSFGSAASHYGPQFDNFGANLVKSAVIGGTASKLGGGKFENGAISAAFQHLFNSGMSRLRDSTFDGGTGIPSGRDDRLQVSAGDVAKALTNGAMDALPDRIELGMAVGLKNRTLWLDDSGNGLLGFDIGADLSFSKSHRFDNYYDQRTMFEVHGAFAVVRPGEGEVGF